MKKRKATLLSRIKEGDLVEVIGNVLVCSGASREITILSGKVGTAQHISRKLTRPSTATILVDGKHYPVQLRQLRKVDI